MLTARQGDPKWYNQDENFLAAVKAVLLAKTKALGVNKTLRSERVKELRAEGVTDAVILQEFEDGWIVNDAEWIAAVGGKEQL